MPVCEPLILGWEKPWKKWPEEVSVWLRKVGVGRGVVVVEEDEDEDGGVDEGVDAELNGRVCVSKP